MVNTVTQLKPKMEQINFGYSMKNIPLSNANSYKKKYIEKLESFFKRMRWALIHHKNKRCSKQKETYGFNTPKCPEQGDELKDFEHDNYELLRNIEFRNKQSEFQKRLAKDVKAIKSSDKVYVHADKSTNIYTLSKESYNKMLSDNITKTYKKADDDLKQEIDSEASVIAQRLELDDRMEVFAERKPFITLKDHKPNFNTKPSARLIVPSKSEMGIISQQKLKKIVSDIRLSTEFNQWKNTTSVIDWFNKLDNKKDLSFIKFDIEAFYPSITEDILQKSIEWASTVVEISPDDVEIINHSRRSLLFSDKSTWIKKDGTDFDVTMGSYDGAEVCELVGLYMLNLLCKKFGKKYIGLYRDDGLAALPFSAQQADRARKQIIQIFKSCGFNITIEIMLKQTDYLDVTFDLPTGKYWPYRKPNNVPLYVHADSNHPHVVLKHLPQNITHRLSSISCDESEFTKSKPIYQKALEESGFKTEMNFIDLSTKPKARRVRRKNIIWFNPPFDMNVKTNVAKEFLKLVSKHFPRGSELYKLFNRNTVKISYCTMNNMSSVISAHNAKVLNDDPPTQDKCNCRKPDECPLNGNCLAESVIYKAAVSAENLPTKYYYGMAEGDFKHRWSDHKTSFSYAKYRSKTELAQYIWTLKETHKIPLENIQIKWSIDRKSSRYRCGTRRCDLCISEKLSILNAAPETLLNSRDEIVSFCRHMSKFRYKNVKRVRKRKAKNKP